MFEVSWCVGLYVTVLAGGVPAGAVRALGPEAGDGDAGRSTRPSTWSSPSTLFVYLMSRNVVYAGAALVGLRASSPAASGRRPGEKPSPIMLAIAAVTLSTMHQSSLGSLFLLMPDKLASAWWSPVMPVNFFLSSIAAGTALMILVEMWIAKAWKRQLRHDQLAALGKVALRRARGVRGVPPRRPRPSAASSATRLHRARRPALFARRARRSAGSCRSPSSARRSSARTRGRCSSARALAAGGHRASTASTW